MTELSFTKQFLSTLISRPLRIAPDFCEDPRKLPARSPYTLPKTAKPKAKRNTTPGSTLTTDITIRSLRGPPIMHHLPKTPLSTTALSLKHALSVSIKTPADRLKLMHKGRVMADLKTLEDVGVEAGGEVVLSVMVMPGGGSDAGPPGGKKRKGVEVVEEEAFWRDLGVWLKERVGGEDADGVVKVFKEAWKGRKVE